VKEGYFNKMVELTIYTNKFDSRENVCGNGMSGKVFIDIMGNVDESGQEFNSLDDALEYACKNNVTISHILINYLGTDGTQMFRRFCISQNNGKYE